MLRQLEEALFCLGLSLGSPVFWLLCLAGVVGLLAGMLFLVYLLTGAIYFLFKPDLDKVDASIPENKMPVLRPIPVKTKNQGVIKRFMVYMLVPRTWKLLQNWHWKYFDKEKGAYVELVVPKGFVCDLASIPRPFRAFFNPAGLLLLPAMLHDYAFEYNQLWQVDDNGEYVPYVPEDCCCSRTQKRYWDTLLFEAGRQINDSWLINKIPDKFTPVLVDLLGHGKSSSPADPKFTPSDS